MVTVLKILSDLKEKKISASTVEKELGFSNGLLGKAAKETTKLSPEKMTKLEVYYISHMGNIKEAVKLQVDTIDLPIHEEPKLEGTTAYGSSFKKHPEWIKLIFDYCQEKGIIPEDLIASHKNQDRFKVGEKVGGDGIITKVVTDEKGQTDHVKPERVHVAQLSNFMKELQKKKNGQS